MQFTLLIAFVAFFSAVVALPAGHTFMRATCDIAGCVAALAPSVVSCAAAAAQAGANVISDAACLASAVNSAVNLPADCDQCLDEFNVKAKAESAVKAAGTKVKEAGTKIKDTAKDVAEDAGDVFDKVGDKLGSIF
ncbi:hypothetical protein D9615_010436 [Tricholomella constricta]|uniref:Fungal calcium binding protein domain-containing protein n=1 Tax=Tricholomella constricta TaxID=117010 RepID=A0A8H5LT63_9AGAR|nr:hypothetical protein D9615_010436 [Tricholomella constricta]